MPIAWAPPHGGGPHHSWCRAPQALDRRVRQPPLHDAAFPYEERARCIDRRLHVHPVVDHVGDELYVAHRLVVRAHDAERHFAPAVAKGERRNDRVHRPLARAERVGMAGIEHETSAAVGQHDAGFLCADADAESGEQRVDQRDRHAVAVDHREVDGVACRATGRAGSGTRRARSMRPASFAANFLSSKSGGELAWRPDRRYGYRAPHRRGAPPRARHGNGRGRAGPARRDRSSPGC